MKKFVEESWLVITLGVVFALLLAGTQMAMLGKINANEAAATLDAVAAVVPGMTDSSEHELDVDGDKFKVFKCMGEDGQLVGWAVEASGGGFIDKITLVVGLSQDGATISGIQAVKHSETPGLGNKINSGNPFPEQYAGKSTVKPLVVEKRPARADHEIEAITGATWSSRYVTDIVNDVSKRVVPRLSELE